MNNQTSFENYIIFLETLSPATVKHLNKHVQSNVLFRDPLHQVHTANEMAEILTKTFETVRDIKFKVIDRTADLNFAYFKWHLDGLLSNKPWHVEGVTYLKFDDAAKIIEHIEYWDAASQLYERFPIIGPLLRYIRRRIAGSPENQI